MDDFSIKGETPEWRSGLFMFLFMFIFEMVCIRCILLYSYKLEQVLHAFLF